ncbi:MAG: Plug domain-containing protein [Candidatus Cybelea sp.]
MTKRAHRYPTIGRVVSHGRNQHLIGKSPAASVGSIDQKQIKTRPVLRPGEVLEAIPGLLISQHSGEGKANQYYLRGFQLDHGTDLESTIVGTPINLPTHAHGQGYSDINWLIPELVSYVDFEKGPYYAYNGDFSAAGAYTVYYKNTLDAPLTELGIGDYAYGNLLIAASPRVGAGNLLYAFQIYHDNGSFERADE